MPKQKPRFTTGKGVAPGERPKTKDRRFGQFGKPKGSHANCGPRGAELDIQKLKDLAILGCTLKEMAGVMRVNIETLSRHIEKYPELATAIEEGYANGNVSLRRLQMRSARGGNVPMLIHLGKNRLDQSDKVKNEHSGAIEVVPSFESDI